MKNQEIRILIVDDTPENLDVLSMYLENLNYHTFVANDAQGIVERVERIKPDLILLDIMMPIVDGYKACELLKANPITNKIPVIFLTASTGVNQVVRGFSVGAVDYITKPFHQQEVLARIQTHLSIYHLQRRLQEKNEALEEALLQVKQLTGLLPICSDCKKIRTTEEDWVPMEVYIRSHTDADFTHGFCPECLDKWYGNILTNV
jgi:DNA-binding response OmpR family regulator